MRDIFGTNGGVGDGTGGVSKSQHKPRAGPPTLAKDAGTMAGGPGDAFFTPCHQHFPRLLANQ
jgi:hypothetical protein